MHHSSVISRHLWMSMQTRGLVNHDSLLFFSQSLIDVFIYLFQSISLSISLSLSIYLPINPFIDLLIQSFVPFIRPPIRSFIRQFLHSISIPSFCIHSSVSCFLSSPVTDTAHGDGTGVDASVHHFDDTMTDGESDLWTNPSRSVLPSDLIFLPCLVGGSTFQNPSSQPQRLHFPIIIITIIILARKRSMKIPSPVQPLRILSGRKGKLSKHSS